MVVEGKKKGSVQERREGREGRKDGGRERSKGGREGGEGRK